MTQETALAVNGLTNNTNETVATTRLDPYVGGVAHEAPRVDALAIISCGYRGEPQGNRPGLPRASRQGDDRQIHLHDPMNRAPGLRAALEATGYRSLLITFPLEEGFLVQRFSRYSATRLEVYGDARSITWIDDRNPEKPVHHTFEGGTDEYRRLAATCKADTRIYFTLAEWGKDGPEVVFADGLGFYAIRTTSAHSVRSIQSTIDYTRRFTRRIAGLPFVLEIDYREVAGPDGRKRTIPVWTITTRPPEGIRLSSRTFSAIATQALTQGAALMLPAPSPETWEDAEAAGPPPIDEPTDEEMAQLAEGGLCDYDHWIKTWHALARGTRFEADAAREAFIADYTSGQDASLAEFLRGTSEEGAAGLIAALGEAVSQDRRARLSGQHQAIFGTEEDWDENRMPGPAASETPATVEQPAPAGASEEPWHCADCGEEYAAMRWLQDGQEIVGPITTWLAFLREQGIDDAICRTCATKRRGKAKP
ncbi:MAG: hypothetical protein NUW22_15920 [Acidobacteria bacterium]|nr:hypothetical protein [Acidobacteriota bacterium]